MDIFRQMNRDFLFPDVDIEKDISMNWKRLMFISLDYLEIGKTIEIPISLEYEYFINSIFENLFYPHRVIDDEYKGNKDNVYAVGKLYSFRIIPKEELLQLKSNGSNSYLLINKIKALNNL